MGLVINQVFDAREETLALFQVLVLAATTNSS